MSCIMKYVQVTITDETEVYDCEIYVYLSITFLRIRSNEMSFFWSFYLDRIASCSIFDKFHLLILLTIRVRKFKVSTSTTFLHLSSCTSVRNIYP